MFDTRYVIRCDGGVRPDGTYCNDSLSDSLKSSLKSKAKGLGWTTTRRLLDLTTHICPACQFAARRAGSDKSKAAR